VTAREAAGFQGAAALDAVTGPCRVYAQNCLDAQNAGVVHGEGVVLEHVVEHDVVAQQYFVTVVVVAVADQNAASVPGALDVQDAEASQGAVAVQNEAVQGALDVSVAVNDHDYAAVHDVVTVQDAAYAWDIVNSAWD